MPRPPAGRRAIGRYIPRHGGAVAVLAAALLVAGACRGASPEPEGRWPDSSGGPVLTEVAGAAAPAATRSGPDASAAGGRRSSDGTRAAGSPAPSAVPTAIGVAVRGSAVVGATRDVETRLVAEVYAWALRSDGIDPELQLGFASDLDAHRALVAGAIDVYPLRPSAAARVIGLTPPAEPSSLPTSVAEAFALFGARVLAPAALDADAPSPVVREEVLEMQPEIEEILISASARLDAATMDRLIDAVLVDRREPAAAVGLVLGGGGGR